MQIRLSIYQHPLTGCESGSVIWEWGHHMFDINAAERKWIPQRGGPPLRLLQAFAFVGQCRLKAVAAAGQRSSV